MLFRSLMLDAAILGFGRDEHQTKIALAAYFIAEKRGFAPGHELDDWLAAEAELAQAEQQPRVTKSTHFIQAKSVS